MAGAIITTSPVVAFLLAIQRNIASGLTAGAVEGITNYPKENEDV